MDHLSRKTENGQRAKRAAQDIASASVARGVIKNAREHKDAPNKQVEAIKKADVLGTPLKEVRGS